MMLIWSWVSGRGSVSCVVCGGEPDLCGEAVGADDGEERGGEDGAGYLIEGEG